MLIDPSANRVSQTDGFLPPRFVLVEHQLAIRYSRDKFVCDVLLLFNLPGSNFKIPVFFLIHYIPVRFQMLVMTMHLVALSVVFCVRLYPLEVPTTLYSLFSCCPFPASLACYYHHTSSYLSSPSVKAESCWENL